MRRLYKQLLDKHFNPDEIRNKVHLVHQEYGIPVSMVYDGEIVNSPVRAKIRLQVIGEKDIIIYLPRHLSDGSIPPEFNDPKYQPRTNVTFCTAEKLHKLVATLIDQPQ